MEITKTFHAADRKTWRDWLKRHYKSEREIWLVYYRKQADKPRIPYNDAVEEALCFGWIDSIVKNIDSERIAQRFSPRKARRAYSQANKERLKRLVARGKVAKDVVADLGGILSEKFQIPADILAALKADQTAWRNYRRFSGSYQRIRIGFIDAARKRPVEFQKRLRHFIQMTEQDKQYGYGIETYY
jgi:uncharacterized protein YdeI (YjbR/CyaY-like superfamily)